MTTATPVLDACCGSRMFWFDRVDPRAIFVDNRQTSRLSHRGFAECFRVLRPDGTLIFKWNEHEIPVSQILALTPHKPLFGQRCGKTAKTHWIVFMKPGNT